MKGVAFVGGQCCQFRYTSIDRHMHSGHITEQDEESLSFNENTVIQVYNGLDSSNDLQSGSAEDEDISLTHSLHRQMEVLHQEKNHARVPPRQSHGRQQHRRDIESKYDLDVSPSTKEEQSLLNQYSNNFLKQPTNRNRSHHAEPRLGLCPEYSNDGGSSRGSRMEEDSDGRRGRMGRMDRKAEVFDIDNFLNAHPVGPKSKKGVSLFREVRKDNRQETKVKVQQNDSRFASEESISLITLPELKSGEGVEAERRRMLEAVRRGEAEMEAMSGGYQLKLDEARLNFIDTFMPVGLKVKSNPYALYKYIASKPKY